MINIKCLFRITAVEIRHGGLLIHSTVVKSIQFTLTIFSVRNVK